MKKELLIKENYFEKIKASLNSKFFRKLYVKSKKGKEDILKNGELSCAYFVSSVLYLNKLIKDIHTTVKSTVKDLEKSGWYRIKEPKKGAVLVWEKKKFSDGYHFHIGFYWGGKKAISNSRNSKCPVLHHFTFNGKRKIIAVYFHKKLED
jgi:hypothetical protein